jgi:cytoskeletal protein CcmA (bactofilin family)
VTVLPLAAALCIAIGAPDARAALVRLEDEVIVHSHEVIEDDLVAYGRYLRIDGVVKGDVVLIGQEVVVEGIVEGDLLAAGKTVYLDGAANDDARIAAYALALGERARVADDCFVLAYSLESKSGSRVGGTLYTAGRQALLSGQVVESLRARTGALELRGLVGGDLAATLGGFEGFTVTSLVVDPALEIPEVEDGLRVVSGARIGGDLDYSAPQPATIEQGARIAGQTRYAVAREPPAPPSPEELEELDRESGPGDALGRLAMLVALGLALVLLAPRWALARGTAIRERPISTLGWGFGFVVFTGMASLVFGSICAILLVLSSQVAAELAISIAAAGFLLQAALFAPFLLATFYLAPLLFSLAAGRFALEKLGAGLAESMSDSKRGVAAVCAGSLVYASLRAIPGFGPVVAVMAALMGLGAIGFWLRERTRVGARASSWEAD